MASPAVLVLVPGIGGGHPEEPFSVVEETAPALHVIDQGVTRGDGVFETIGYFDGSPMNLEPHLARLVRSAGMLSLPVPDLDVLRRAVAAAVAEHEDAPDLSVRIVLTRGDEGTDAPTGWIHVQESADWSQQRAGIRVAALDRGVSTRTPASSPWLLLGAKTLSYAVNMAATREARSRGADDVLFVSSDGYALEGPTSTLLVRRGDRFSTTPPWAGVLPGTCVTTVQQHLESQGGTVDEDLMTVADVAGSDGAWLLSSTRLAAPITHVDSSELPVDRELSETFVAVLSGRA